VVEVCIANLGSKCNGDYGEARLNAKKLALRQVSEKVTFDMKRIPDAGLDPARKRKDYIKE